MYIILLSSLVLVSLIVTNATLTVKDSTLSQVKVLKSIRPMINKLSQLIPEHWHAAVPSSSEKSESIPDGYIVSEIYIEVIVRTAE